MTVLAERTASAFLAGMLAGLTSLDVCVRGIAPAGDDSPASVGASPSPEAGRFPPCRLPSAAAGLGPQ